MSTLQLVSLLVYSFGAISFGALGFLGLQTYRTAKPDARAVARGALTTASTLWFVILVIRVLAHSGAFDPHLPDLLMFMTAFLFAPLMMQIFYVEVRTARADRLWWRLPIVLVWIVSIGSMVSLIAIQRASPPWSWQVARTFMTVNFVLWGVAVAYSVAAGTKSKTPKTNTEDRSHRRAIIVVLAVTVLLVAVGPLLGPEAWVRNELLQLVGFSTPLYFVFVGTYYRARITFYDIFIQHGVLAFLALAILTAYFGVIAPRLAALPIGGAIAWVHAVALLPLILATPWLYRRIDFWVDWHWLGRRFTPEHATRHLFSGLRTATTESELVHQVESQLREIFQAPAYMTTDAVALAEGREPAVCDVPIEFHGEPAGRIEMGRRPGGSPYLSEDVALLRTLAGLIAPFLANVRLQARRREQDQLEQELRLHASRSELKALRAQINPHFLFNALNAIAALIPHDPGRAEDTVEQLSQVFRYTLTRSESEWARLADEMEFVRAYLEVERARFGDRLQASINVDPDVRDARVPSMMLQTLVENAIKHGLSSVRAVGVLSIDAGRIGDRLRLTVRDNGPGFEGANGPLEATAPAGAGYGLWNIRARLQGYFGDRAAFSISRDAPGAATVASIELPLVTQAVTR